MSVLGSLASSLFGSQPSSQPYLQQAEQARLQAEQDRQRAIQAQQQQMALAGYLQMVLSGGGGPSVAQNQLMQGLEQARASQMSMAAGQGGPGSALARYLAAAGTGQLQAQTNQQAALVRAQEQGQIRGQLGQTLGQVSQGSTQLTGIGTQAGLGYSGQGMQTDQFGANRQMQQEGAILQGLGGAGSVLFNPQQGAKPGP